MIEGEIMKNYPPSIQGLRKDIKALETLFDEIVKKLRNTAMVKCHYDLVEGDLRDAVYSFKDECDTL